jgi:hypothetical protein
MVVWVDTRITGKEAFVALSWHLLGRIKRHTKVARTVGAEIQTGYYMLCLIQG